MAVFRRRIIILAVIFLACILPSYCETETQGEGSQEFVTLTRDRRGAEEAKYYKDDYGGDRKADYERKDKKDIDYKGDEYDEYEFGPFYDYSKLYKPKYSPGRYKYYNRYSPHGYPRSQSYRHSYDDDRYNSRPYSRHYPRYQRKSYPRHSDYYSRRY